MSEPKYRVGDVLVVTKDPFYKGHHYYVGLVFTVNDVQITWDGRTQVMDTNIDKSHCTFCDNVEFAAINDSPLANALKES